MLKGNKLFAWRGPTFGKIVSSERGGRLGKGERRGERAKRIVISLSNPKPFPSSLYFIVWFVFYIRL